MVATNSPCKGAGSPPRLLLLDEPLSALDQPPREQLRPDTELRHVLTEFGDLVTHDRTEVMALADRVTLLDHIKSVNGGERGTDEGFNRPADVEVAWIEGTENVLPGRVVQKKRRLANVSVARDAVTDSHPRW
jgi:ABC-type sulfate/molybdate transport systems ATPase subunit